MNNHTAVETLPPQLLPSPPQLLPSPPFPCSSRVDVESIFVELLVSVAIGMRQSFPGSMSRSYRENVIGLDQNLAMEPL